VTNKDSFLSAVREAVARGRMHPVALDPMATAQASYVGAGADPAGRLLEEWVLVGGQGARVRGAAAAQRYLRAFFAEQAVTSAVLWRHPVLQRLDVAGLLAEAGASATCWDRAAAYSEPLRAAAFSCEWGITSVDWAVAETGTLALCAQPGQGRLVSLLPPRYLAIVETAQILPDLFDLFAALEPMKHGLPSTIALVTGPSKTGDIELKLTTGVHGPGQVHLLIVEPETA